MRIKKQIKKVVPTILYILGCVALFMAFTVPGKVIDRSNCMDVCEANGDKPFWRISMGCFCKDERGLYNPRDERQKGQ